MLERKIGTLAKILLIISTFLVCACSNEMVPISNPPEYQNQLVQDRNGKWHVVVIQCPILYDSTGHIKPSSNYGCANVHNLGLMLANPEDLLYSNKSGNTILYKKNKPLIYRNQSMAKSAQKYYNDKLPKLEDINNTSSFMGAGLGL